ncbi:hypothetical protein MiYa_00781 [Microcystis aeruginosa NIES-2519]|uniref:Chromosome partition protein Smc n=1 Tax=Microcystis aeruginosa NIES-2519 TaxID=2303981 RepID=A0A5A5RA44_MICAE|nr:hypothetical protein [Microcystis aeruginosa]GCA69256.1 hypothetical protein MiYa_00781 [Microcystis aeruginosa NIES-2519]GCA82124.1 hypothetical protein MiHa_00074 [Microcystis aeruginosa NIES-2522]
MRVRKTFLILYLATGLSAGLLSGCNLSGHQAQHSSSSSATGSSMGQSTTVADAQQTAAIKNLKALRQKRKALNTFVANIEVTESGTKVENPVDYAEAKKIVDELANAYKTFKDSLSDDIKTKIGFNNIDSKIEPILEGTSQQRKILEDLAKEQYSEAQNKLSQLKIDSQPIYQSDIDGEDGSRQRIATKKLLEQILNETEPLATLTIDNSSTQNPITSNSLTNSLTTDDLKTQLEQLKKDINRNNWIWPLFNTLALLSLSFIFLRSKRSGITITYDETKQLTNSSDEHQKTLVELQKINKEIKGLQEKFSWLQILQFKKKQVDSSAVKQIETRLENVRKQVNELCEKIIISHFVVSSNEAAKGIITGAKSTSPGENTLNTPGESRIQLSDIECIEKPIEPLQSEIKGLGSKQDQFQSKIEGLEKQIQELEKQIQELKKQIEGLENQIEGLKDQKENSLNQVPQLQQPKDNSELTANRTETVNIPQQWEKDIIDSYNQSPEMIFNINGVQLQGEVVEDDQQLEQRRNNLSKPVFLKSHSYPDGYYYIILVENHLVEKHYLLFPKQNAISPSQEFTASALFDGYKSGSGNTSKFTLISPAQVTPVGSSGMWQLKHKGKLEYN